MKTHAPSTSAASGGDSDHAFLGHPRGLAYLGFAEAWERFSYYGMQTLLVLYMTHQLLLPGHVDHIAGFPAFRHFIETMYGGTLSTVALASAIFGLYAGFVYMTPILGGVIADRWLGKTKTIIIGAVLMVAGHFLMAFDSPFLVALLCLLLGVGCFKGNLASQVSDLYSATDLRRADAFQIYYLFINAAVVVAPLIAGTLGEVYGWHYGFGAAGVGMVIGLVIYLAGRKWLPADKEVVRTVSVPRQKLSARERRVIVTLLVMLPVLAIGSVGNQQIFNAYLLWVPDHVDLVFFGKVMPTTWLITVDSVVSFSFLVGSVAFWRLWAKRFQEPSELVKLTIGLGISSLAPLMLVIAAQISAGGGKASIVWVLAYELLNSAGFANVFPVGLALYARASPKRLIGTMVGVYYLHLFMGNNLVGWLGGLLERMSGTQFWMLHVAMVGSACAFMFVVNRLLSRDLLPEQEPALVAGAVPA